VYIYGIVMLYSCDRDVIVLQSFSCSYMAVMW